MSHVSRIAGPRGNFCIGPVDLREPPRAGRLDIERFLGQFQPAHGVAGNLQPHGLQLEALGQAVEQQRRGDAIETAMVECLAQIAGLQAISAAEDRLVQEREHGLRPFAGRAADLAGSAQRFDERVETLAVAAQLVVGDQLHRRSVRPPAARTRRNGHRGSERTAAVPVRKDAVIGSPRHRLPRPVENLVRNNFRRMDLRVRLASGDGLGGPSYKSGGYFARVLSRVARYALDGHMAGSDNHLLCRADPSRQGGYHHHPAKVENVKRLVRSHRNA